MIDWVSASIPSRYYTAHTDQTEMAGRPAPGRTGDHRKALSLRVPSPLTPMGRFSLCAFVLLVPSVAFAQLIVTGSAAPTYAENGTAAVETYSVTGGANISWSLSGIDANDLNIDSNTGVLTFASSPDYEAATDDNTDNVYLVTVEADDGTDTGMLAVTVTVTGVNEFNPVVAGPTMIIVDENTSVATVIATYTGTDADLDDEVSFEIVGTQIDKHDFISGGVTGELVLFSQIPNFEDPDDYDKNNVYEFRMISLDGSATNPATRYSQALPVTVTVQDVNELPVPMDDTATTDEDTAVVIDVLGNDSDPDAGTVLSVTAVMNVTNGTATITDAGDKVTFVPAADSNAAGTFDYTVSDNGTPALTATGAVTVTVNPVNDHPEAQDDSAATDEDTAVQIPVLGNDSDPDGHPVTVTAVESPGDGSVTIAPDGSSVTYEPDENFNGTDRFKYTVSDGETPPLTATGLVTVMVNPVDDAPVAVDDTVGAFLNRAVVVRVLDNDVEVDGDALMVSVAGSPSNGAAAVTGGGTTITYTPNRGYLGSDSFFYDVADVATPATTDTGMVTVEVIESSLLSNLTISAGTLSPPFGADTTSYYATVANQVSRVTVTPTTVDDQASVTVNGKTVASGSASAGIRLTAGETTLIDVVVAAWDGGTTQTYTIAVTRGLSGNADLSKLSVSPGTLEPVFAVGTTSYTVRVENAVSSVKVTAEAAHARAAVKVSADGEQVERGGAIPLAEGGTTTISVEVTARDGTVRTYTIAVTREAISGNANLSGLTVSPGTLNPAFDAEITSYTVEVENAVSSVKVTPRAADEGAAVRVSVDGHAPVAAGAGVTIPLTESETTTIDVEVTAEDGMTRAYTIKVTRTASSDASLSGLSLSDGDLAFDAEITSYRVEVENAVSSVTVRPRSAHEGATVTVNGRSVAGGSASRAIPLAEGGTTSIVVEVTSQDGTTTKTYTIEVARAASSNADLSALTISSGTLAPAFRADATNYTANVPNSVADLTVTQTTAHQGATVTVNGGAVSSGSAGVIALAEGATTFISVEVTAQDRTTIKSYVIMVTRAPGVSGSLPSLILYVGGGKERVDAGEAISGNGLSWTFASSDPGVVSIEADGASVVVAPVYTGEAEITATAGNESGSASVAFGVSVRTSAAEEAAVRAALSGQARVLLGSVSEAIGERVAGSRVSVGGCGGPSGGPADDRGFGAGIGGSRFDSGVQVSGGVRSFGDGRRSGMTGDVADAASRIRGRSFSVAPGAASEDCEDVVESVNRRWSLWGAGDVQRASGGTDSGGFDGEWRFLYLGVDRAFGERWMGGVSVSGVWGEADYTFDDERASGSGRLSSDLTSVYPYVRGSFSSGLQLWAVGGLGSGEMENLREHAAGRLEKGDLDMRLASAGLHKPLSRFGGAELSLTGDAGLVSLSVEGDGSLEGADASVSRIRLGLELARRFASGAEPFARLYGRRDGGDGETGAAAETVLGMRYTGGRLNLEVRGNYLMSEADFEQWGATAQVGYGRAADSSGLAWSLATQWGASGSVGSFLRGSTMRMPGAGAGSALGESLSAEFSGEIGYGLSVSVLGLPGRLMPNLGYDHSGYGDVRARLGLSYLLFGNTASGFRLRLDIARTDRRETVPDDSIELNAALRIGSGRFQIP